MPRRRRRPTVKIHCAYKQCRSGKDVKNVGAQLTAKRETVNLSDCRALRQHCCVVRFCCAEHKKRCATGKPVPENPKRGGRECLDANQVAHLFKTFVRRDEPWVAILMLIQMFCADRADCCRRACRGWFQSLDPQDGQPPTMHIPRVNGKTRARNVPVDEQFAKLLHGWLTVCPLKGPNSQWPFEGQETNAETAVLFPGRVRGGTNRRDWDTPISRRAFHGKVVAAAGDLIAERAEDRRAGKPHPFDDCDLTKVGTHSFKKTGVTLLKDVCRSTAVVSAISGTSAETLDTVYDVPTAKRQRQAVGDAFSGILDRVTGNPASSSSAASGRAGDGAAVRFCPHCGQQRADPQWVWCPHCGRKF